MKTASSIALAFAFALLVSMVFMAIAPGENHGNIWTPDYTATKLAFALSWIVASVVIGYRSDWPDIFLRAMIFGALGWSALAVQSLYPGWLVSWIPISMTAFCVTCFALSFRLRP